MSSLSLSSELFEDEFELEFDEEFELLFDDELLLLFDEELLLELDEEFELEFELLFELELLFEFEFQPPVSSSSPCWHTRALKRTIWAFCPFTRLPLRQYLPVAAEAGPAPKRPVRLVAVTRATVKTDLKLFMVISCDLLRQVSRLHPNNATARRLFRPPPKHFPAAKGGKPGHNRNHIRKHMCQVTFSI